MKSGNKLLILVILLLDLRNLGEQKLPTLTFSLPRDNFLICYNIFIVQLTSLCSLLAKINYINE